MELDFARLDRAFSPRSIAVVGDKEELRWLHAESAFKGKIYSVQVNPVTIKAIEALGIKNYTSLLDIPHPLDLVIVAVPRAVAPQILEDCILKGAAAAQFYTSGFAETDTEEGKRLERLLAERAKQADFHLIGPNCMGIFNPGIGVKQIEMQYSGTQGQVGFISQSGTHAIAFSMAGHLQGVDLNKSVSFGNGSVLDSPDYLAYFGQDDGIKVIGMYLEGVKDGRKFLSVLREVSQIKPVVIWKGGRTSAGFRAAASHTGSLAVSQAIWNVAMKQGGGIGVNNLEEIIDTVKALLYLPPVRGGRMGITGGSGGQSVAITDAFTEEGLEVPRLAWESYAELATFFTLIGGSYNNPVDTGNVNRKEMKRILEILERDANIDNVAMVIRPPGGWRKPEEIEVDIRLAIDFKRRGAKPLVVVSPYFTSEEMEQVSEIARKLHGGGVPVFYTFERCARAIKNALAYYKFKEGVL